MTLRTAPVDEAALDALRESIVSVLADQCSSTAIHAFLDGRQALGRTLWRHASELGWLGVGIGEQHGGLGMGVRGLDVLHTCLGGHVAPGPYLATLSAAQVIEEAGDAAVQAAWLPRIASGAVSAAVPATPGSASLALPDGTLSGTLRCLGAEDAAFVLAPVETGAWALVELRDAPIRKIEMWDRTRSMIDIRIDRAMPAAMLTDGAAASAALTRSLSLAVAADSRGGARAIAERTIAYMKAREQFGRPIASFQALKHRAADLMTKLAVTDEIVAHGIETAALASDDADLWAVLAKSEASDAFAGIATDCLQLHGGVGFTWDFDPHVFLKRARLNEMLVMSNTALRDRAAARLATATEAGRSAMELTLV